uniref:Ig-like domain-containing protein n=1 Tax=Pygocentrus nattereri TaxID=42514 RepID=A0A3B4E9X1_PYGNA
SVVYFSHKNVFLSVQTSDFDDLRVQAVKYGENVTIKCEQSFVKGHKHYLAWYKQSFGKLPQFIARADKHNANVRYALPFVERFRLTATEETFDLKIMNTVEEDTGTYFCVKVKEYVTEFGSGILLLFPGTSSDLINDFKSSETDSPTQKDNIWIFALTTTNVITLTVTIILAVLLFKNQRKGCFTDHPNHTNQVANTDALNYAALNFAKKPPPSRTSRVKERQDIYSQVKLR